MPAPPLPPGQPNLVVTGFMGTGKTAAGREAASLLGMPFIDLDQVVAGRAGRPIADLIAAHGEERFRALERQAVADAARLSGSVVATGGGAPLNAASFEPLARTGRVVVLRCDPAELGRRLGSGSGRPLLREPGAIRTLLAERASAYEVAGEALDTTARSMTDTAGDLARLAPETGPLELRVGPTTVLLGEALDGLPARLQRTFQRATAAIVLADPRAQIAGAVTAAAETSGLATHRLDLPSGETAKDVAVLHYLWRALARIMPTRDDPVLVVGGGAVLDAGGFAAATFLRGVPTVLVPTTLLAMADACLGGKVAVDLDGAKNLVGTFHPPALVVADPRALDGLPPGVMQEGMAEVVKAGMLASPLLLETLATGPPSGWVVEQALRIKAAYVLADPRDHGLRRALNLGHTFGHAIEAATGYRVPHGEAVAVGLAAAARLGAALGISPPDAGSRIAGTLAALDLPADPPPGLDRASVAAAMMADKKRTGSGPAFVLPAEDGAVLVEGIDLDVALDALLRGAS